MGAEIRDARPDEYATVGHICQEAYAQYLVGNEDSPDWRSYYDEDIPDVEGRLPDGIPIVALVDGEIAAAVTYYPPGRAGSEGWTEGIAAIRLLAVPPARRGLGLGRLLTEECIRRAKEDGATAVGLHNHHTMAVARAMYLRMGFEPYTHNDFDAGSEHVDAFILRRL